MFFFIAFIVNQSEIYKFNQNTNNTVAEMNMVSGTDRFIIVFH